MTIRTEGLTVRFPRGFRRGTLTALDGVDLEVHAGDFYALLGSNGAGKTTALHCLLGLLRPTAGRVEVLGQRPEPGAPLFSQVGFLPEEPRYHDYLTVEEAATYYARLSGIRTPAVRIAALLERLGLAEHRTLRVGRCSKGMKQKLGIVQCVAHAPRLLFLDEPMRGLDPAAVHLFRDLLIEMNRDGVTIVMSSHLLGEVELVANRVAILARGRLAVQDDLASLMRKDADRYMVEFQAFDGPLPAFVREATRHNGAVRGLVGATDLYSFVDFTRVHELKLLSCALHRQTLEDSYMAVIREGGSHV